MLSDSEIVALCEAIEVHVSKNPSPYSTEMPIAVQERLLTATIDEASRQKLKHRIWLRMILELKLRKIYVMVSKRLFDELNT